MDKEKILGELGLTRNQSRIYLALLSLGDSTVRDISKKTGFQRPNIYDILEELKEKGLVTYFKEGKSSFYKAVDPESLVMMLKEKEEMLSSLLPELAKMKYEKGDVDVQVYKGEKGIKASFNKILKYKNITIYAINVHSQLQDSMPVYAKQYFRQRVENNIRYKAIYTSENTASIPLAEIRYSDAGQYNPTVTYIYEDTVLIHIWHPVLVGIEIKSNLIADAYRKYFDSMWKTASRKPVKK